MSDTNCRMPGCHWSISFDDIEQHFNIFHPKQIIKINPGSYFELTFDDLQSRNPLLLLTNNGVYWFTLNVHEQRPGYFSRGVFAIGESERVQYYIKLGKFSTRTMEILGPFEAQAENSNQYNFDMRLDYMEQLRCTMTPKVVIYFGDFEEEADEYDELGKLSPPAKFTEILHEDSKYSKFVCSACVRIIPEEPFLWRDRHHLCSNCYKVVLLCVQHPELVN